MKNKIIKLSILSILFILLFSGCADVVNVNQCLVEAQPHIYGFWGGLWHGMILPFSWIGSLFSDDIAIYAISNNGGWYNFGYVLGVSLAFGGGYSTTK